MWSGRVNDMQRSWLCDRWRKTMLPVALLLIFTLPPVSFLITSQLIKLLRLSSCYLSVCVCVCAGSLACKNTCTHSPISVLTIRQPQESAAHCVCSSVRAPYRYCSVRHFCSWHHWSVKYTRKYTNSLMCIQAVSLPGDINTFSSTEKVTKTLRNLLWSPFVVENQGSVWNVLLGFLFFHFLSTEASAEQDYLKIRFCHIQRLYLLEIWSLASALSDLKRERVVCVKLYQRNLAI